MFYILERQNAFKLLCTEKRMERGVFSVTRREIEAKLSTVGDYVKMDYLQQCLKKNLDFDTRKFALTKLAGIYETRNMLLEAGKLMRNAADINTTYEAKMNDFMKSAELLIKAGAFDDADVSLNKALACATEKQKPLLKAKAKEIYKTQATDMVKRDKRKNAMQAYEKLLSMELNPEEKRTVQQALLPLYEKLGKVSEYMQLSKSI